MSATRASGAGNVRLMTHMVAHYPDKETGFEVGRALIDGGSSYLEIQFPFSDPTADGPAIQDACTRALEAGFRVRDGFELVRRLREYSNTPVFIMSYASVVVAGGVQEFLTHAKTAGAAGLIIPDLPLDGDEGLYAAGRTMSLDVVPVVVPTMRDARLQLVRDARPEFVYAALRTGITGVYTAIGEENLVFLQRLKSMGAKVLAGFGVREYSQVKALMPHVHAVVVGSALVSTITGNLEKPKCIADAVRRKVAELTDAPIDA